MPVCFRYSFTVMCCMLRCKFAVLRHTREFCLLCAVMACWQVAVVTLWYHWEYLILSNSQSHSVLVAEWWAHSLWMNASILPVCFCWSVWSVGLMTKLEDKLNRTTRRAHLWCFTAFDELLHDRPITKPLPLWCCHLPNNSKVLLSCWKYSTWL